MYEIPHPFKLPCFGDTTDAQCKPTKDELQGASLKEKRIWIHEGHIALPIADMEIISHICIIAHAGGAGHTQRDCPNMMHNQTLFLFQKTCLQPSSTL